MFKCSSVSQDVYRAIQTVNIELLSKCSEKELRPILPCLVRMSLCSPLDNSENWTYKRKLILKCLSGIEVVNNLVGLLSIDFHELEQDAKKEQQTGHTDASTTPAYGVALEFERSDAARKLRLMLTEILSIITQLKQQQANNKFAEKSSELFDTEIYLEEVSDVLCISQSELPHLLPMTEVAEALLRVRNGSWLLCRLVANNPDSFLDVCDQLISAAPKNGGIESEKRTMTLKMLCSMSPSYLSLVRDMCVRQCKLVSLVVLLTLREVDGFKGINDLVSFVSGLLLESDSVVRLWFAQSIKASDKKKDVSTPIHLMRRNLLSDLKSLLEGEGDGNGGVMKACAFVRLYCALKCIAGVKFNEEESVLLLRLAVLKPSRSCHTRSRFFSLALSLLLSCPQLVVNEDHERVVTEWLKWLVDEATPQLPLELQPLQPPQIQSHQPLQPHHPAITVTRISSSKTSNSSEMLLLIAIHFHSNQGNAISELISTTLGMKAVVKTSAHSRMKLIFTTLVFTEQVVAAHAVKVAVTEGLSGHMKAFLPIHCIHQLLKSRVFSKNRICIKDWIHSQMNQCTLPLHPIIPPLIQLYIFSIIVPTIKADRANIPLSEADLSAVFLADRRSNKVSLSDITVQLVHLYYILMYQDVLLANMSHLKSNNRAFFTYSANFINTIPIKYLLSLAESHSCELSSLYSSLLALVATHHPHLSLLNHDCIGLTTPLLFHKHVENEDVISNHEVHTALHHTHSNPSACCVALEKLSSLPTTHLVDFYGVISDNLEVFLSDGVPRRCQELLSDLWSRLDTISPQLKTATVNAFQASFASSRLLYKESQIINDPLIVLKCDCKVFKNPPILAIMLKNLNCFLQMSKTYLANHILMNPGCDVKVQILDEREELRVAIVAAQESAALQLLLEACLHLQDFEVNNETLLTDARESQCLILSHIHQKFISDPSLAKLIHFQGYPIELIPLVVRGVPSMFICLDFLPELIAQPQRSKLSFGIRLMSHLGLQYPVPKSLSVAKLGLNVMHTMLTILTSYQRCLFYSVTLPDLIRFCTSFPVLIEDTISLLIQLGKILQSELILESPGFFVDRYISSCHDDWDESVGVDTQFTCERLLSRVFATFDKIVGSTSLLKIKLCP